MMKNYKVMWIVLLALCGALVPGALLPLSAAENGIDFSIRFFDRRIYYVAASSVEGDPVYIQVTVTNNSPSAYRFKLADERAFSLDFEVRTTTNRLLEQADTVIRKRTESQQVFFREIAVEAGESFSFVEDLRSYVKLDEPGSFIVKARLFPELLRSSIKQTASVAPAASSAAIESQRLNLNIRPPVIYGPDGIPQEMDVATGAVLVRERLAPDQVVDYTLTARQKSQWEKFFLYLDIESMLSQDSAQQRKYLNESEAGRRRMVEQYRQELRNSVTDGTISVIPSEYVIERTQYSHFEGTVVVLEKFKSSNYTELKRYTYVMRQKDNIWYIADYSVVNLGTE
jgi:hypothetical protein